MKDIQAHVVKSNNGHALPTMTVDGYAPFRGRETISRTHIAIGGHQRSLYGLSMITFRACTYINRKTYFNFLLIKDYVIFSSLISFNLIIKVNFIVAVLIDTPIGRRIFLGAEA